MEIPETIRFIPKGFELGTTLSLPNRSIREAMTDGRQTKTFCRLKVIYSSTLV